MVSHPQTGGTALKDDFRHDRFPASKREGRRGAASVENESSRLIAGAWPQEPVALAFGPSEGPFIGSGEMAFRD